MKTAKALLTIGSLIGARKAMRALHDFDLDDVLGVAGLRRRGDWPARFGSSLAVAAVAAAVGAGAALLLAPSSGTELRQRISSRAKGLKDQASHKAGELQREWKRDQPMHNS